MDHQSITQKADQDPLLVTEQQKKERRLGNNDGPPELYHESPFRALPDAFTNTGNSGGGYGPGGSENRYTSVLMDRHGPQPPPPGAKEAGEAAGESSSTSNPYPNPSSGGGPAPPPKPPSNPIEEYRSYQGYPTYQPQGAYNSSYDNPYARYYDQPVYDNPNSLYPSTGQVFSSQEPSTLTPNPFSLPGDPYNPFLYDDAPPRPPGTTPAFSASTSRRRNVASGTNSTSPTPGSIPDASKAAPGPYTPEEYGDVPLLRRPQENTPPNDDEKENIRYGRIPQRVPRRYKTIKKVQLFHGNLVLDCPVPSKLLDLCRSKTEREFTHMRYTAATCDPNDFAGQGFTLRQMLYDPPRKAELFIVITIYNEDDELLCRTMSGVMRNIQHLISRDRSKTWGKEAWRKVVVCVVADGRTRINSRALSVLATLGCYQDGVAKGQVGGKLVTAHIYEYSTQVFVTSRGKIAPQREYAPVQIIFCLKEKNQKKINSHRWFFNAFGPVLQPNVCVLLDVGTMPGPTSIYHLWKCFDINASVGGACGELRILQDGFGANLLNPLVAAQNYEYKMGNILDKPLESMFGYITVLPGAFSAYRYIALQNNVMGEGPLQKYFLGETMHGAGADVFTANMYLAEDRILCWELVTKRGGSWVLHYVKSAYAETDVPEELPELIWQRRRWVNGAFFVAIYSSLRFYYIYRSGHNVFRMLVLQIQMAYQLFRLIFDWFALGNFYISFALMINAMEDPTFEIAGIRTINTVLNNMYLGLLIMCYLLALGNRPHGSKVGYTIAFIGYAILTIYMTASGLFLSYKGIDGILKNGTENGYLTVDDFLTNVIFRDIVVNLAATFAVYMIASFIFFEPWHMLTSFVQYILMTPSYIAVLNVYAFANTHDVTWGTKGDNKTATDLGVAVSAKNRRNEVELSIPTEEVDLNAAYDDALAVLSTKPPKMRPLRDAQTKKDDYYASFRTNLLLAWTLTNALLGTIVVNTAAKAADSSAQAAVKGYLAAVLWSVAGLASIRFCGAVAYMLRRLIAGY